MITPSVEINYGFRWFRYMSSTRAFLELLYVDDNEDQASLMIMTSNKVGNKEAEIDYRYNHTPYMSYINVGETIKK